MSVILEAARRFYREEIPNQFNDELDASRRDAEAADESRRIYESLRSVNTTIDVRLEGEFEETFHLNVEAGRMTPGEKGIHPPLVTLVHDADSFTGFSRASGTSVLGFLGGLAGLGNAIRLTAQRLENLSLLSGALRFELLGEGGFHLTLHFGAEPIAADADCVMRLSMETYADLQSGRLEAQDAFFGEQVEIEGDLEMAVRFALAALAPD